MRSFRELDLTVKGGPLVAVAKWSRGMVSIWSADTMAGCGSTPLCVTHGTILMNSLFVTNDKLFGILCCTWSSNNSSFYIRSLHGTLSVAQASEVVLSEGQISDITPVMHLIVVLQSRSSQIDPSLLHLVNELNQYWRFFVCFWTLLPREILWSR